MKISILTIFPRIFDSFLSESILGRAVRQSLLTVETIDIRAFSARKHKNTDDESYGGGAGMVMLAQPIVDAMDFVTRTGSSTHPIVDMMESVTSAEHPAQPMIDTAEFAASTAHPVQPTVAARESMTPISRSTQPMIDSAKPAAPAPPPAHRIYLSPRGTPWTQKRAMELSRESHLVLLCGHYEGVDQRAIDLCIDEEISIGDYIVTGGETAALVLLDSIARLIPGVLGCAESPDDESFVRGLLEYPHYTRPRLFRGLSVPEVLLNGNHAEIQVWRRGEALRITRERRPDLLEKALGEGKM